MSNAMRSGKRTLAGVAAGALGAALIPFIGVGTAQAAVVAASTGVTAPGVNSNVIPRTINAQGIVTEAYYIAGTTATLPFQFLATATDDSVGLTVDDTAGAPLLALSNAVVTSPAGSGLISVSGGDTVLARTGAASTFMSGQVNFTVPSRGAAVTVAMPAATGGTGTGTGATGLSIAAPVVDATQGSTVVTPVRASATGAVPAARVAWNNSSGDDTITDDANIVRVLSAPAGGALTTSTGTVGVDQPIGDVAITVGSDGLSYFEIRATVAGTYTGYIYDRVAPTQQRAFSFTTVGAPATISMTPTSTSAAVSQAVTFTVALRDSNGNLTQPGSLDTVAVTSSPAGGTITTSPLTAANLFDGDATFTYSNGSAGSYSVTATPLGSLGLAPVTSTVSVSGTVADDSVTSLAVTSPATAINGGTLLAGTASVPAGSAAVTVAVTGRANAQVRFAVTANSTGGVVNGVPNGLTFRTNLTLDSLGRGSLPLTLGGTSVTSGSTVTVTQTTAANAALAGGSPELVITQSTPVINDASVSPRGALVAKLGDKVTVSALVANQFGVPAGNYTVQAYRGSYATAPVATSVTGANGIATLELTNAGTAVNGTVETYLYRITSSGGVINNVSSTQNLTITWLTAPAITSVTDATDPVTVIASGKQVSQPLIRVPSGGLVAGGITAYSINPQTLATSPNNDLTLAGTYFAVTSTSSPATNLTVTAPAGVKLVATQPSNAAPVLWSGGSSTLTVGSGSTFYVFATKTGDHTIKVTPVGLTTPSTEVEFTVVNNPIDAYTLESKPAAVSIPANGIKTLEATAKDVFGNLVPGATIDAEVTGPVLFGGLTPSTSFTTNAVTGIATVSLLALSETGNGKVSLTAPATGLGRWAAAAPGYTPPTGAAAPVLASSAEVTVTGGTATKTISIVGERTTVSGKSGIMVEGVTTGLEAGKTVIPYVRFPGGEYTQGTARPKISAAGDFEWSRKTGKKAYVYFTNDDGKVTSNRIIIAAS